MKKIDVASLPVRSGTSYPTAYAGPCMARQALALGRAAGLTQFGVNMVRIAPGAWSSQRHWHSHEDEFVYVLEGEAVMVTDAGEEFLSAGDCAGFKAGDPDGHHFQNRTEDDLVLLVIGSRIDEDTAGYPDIDLKSLPDRYSGTGGYVRKDGSSF